VLVSRFLAAAPVCLALVQAEASPPTEATGASALEPLLPLKIPGYDLRVLDVGKPFILSVGGTQLEASLPVYFYLPNSDQERAMGLVAQAYRELESLSREPEWTAEDLQKVLLDLNGALEIFHGTAP